MSIPSTTLDTLNDLIEVSKDGEYGFRTSAEHMRDTELQQLLLRRADECAQAAAELQSLAAQLGGKVETGGSAAGAMHRGWVAIKATLSGYSDAQILEETERGEDVAMKRYAKALQSELTADARLLVERQYLGVQRNHAQVRELRDRARAARP